MTEFHDFGEPTPDDTELEEHTGAIFRAVVLHSDFRFVEKRTYQGLANVIVVDCFCDGVPTRNNIGIRNKERLALVYLPNEAIPYQVRALRKGFPPTLHQNQVPKGEPAALCVYFQPWSALERSWTPQLHLNTIVWWLENCATGNLHPEEQPLEQLYFESPIHFVLPADFEEKSKNPDLRLAIAPILTPSPNITIVRSLFVPLKWDETQAIRAFECLFLSLNPVIHSAVENYPYTLGELQDQLIHRGSEVISSLVAELGRLAAGGGIPSSPDESKTLLLLDIPIRRTESANPERRGPTAFMVLQSLTKLGEATGILFGPTKGKHHLVTKIGRQKQQETAWRKIPILPLAVEHSITRQFAQSFSGLADGACDFNAVLAGVGALGSALAQIWTREGWGNWTFIDSDYIRPHNIARHIALDSHIGMPKVQAVSQMTAAVFLPGYLKIVGISANANDKHNADVSRAIGDAQLLIDATTTLEVPRDLSNDDKAPRSASAFLTPSGMHSALLMEDERRINRLDSLEAQYYRAIIQSGWGKEHLLGHQGRLWVGAGCRDVTAVIPYDLILMHAAMLSKQIREARLAPSAAIRVWEFQEQARTLLSNEVAVSPSAQCAFGDWTIRFDAEILRKMADLRTSHLPKETGGIVVGYYDQKLRNIYVVDILEPPSDSEESETGFIRGQNGLKDILEEIAERTAYVVEYIGEWHSHPQYSSAWPSSLDVALLAYLEERLSSEGKPGLILILGDKEISFVLK